MLQLPPDVSLEADPDVALQLKLKRRLQYMEEISRQPARKPFASVTTEQTDEEDCEVPDSA